MSSVDRSMAATAAIAHKMDTELSVRRRDRAALWRLRREVHGGRVLIYFGYPKAHEYDAERAVRAGLELVAAVGQLKTTRPYRRV